MLYSLAKREMLLAANESLVGTQQKKLQVTADDFHRTKTRNDQLVKVGCSLVIAECEVVLMTAWLPLKCCIIICCLVIGNGRVFYVLDDNKWCEMTPLKHCSSRMFALSCKSPTVFPIKP